MGGFLSLSETDKLAYRYGDWPKHKLVSGSEVNRNRERLVRLFTEAKARGFRDETLIEIWPGAVVSWLADLLVRPKTKGIRKLFFNLLRLTESFIRHNFSVPLQSLEPNEILSLLRIPEFDGIVSSLKILDRDRRVLDAARRSLSNEDFPVDIIRYNLNDPFSWTSERAGIVCAYKCIHLSHSSTRSLEAIASMMKPYGLLSTTYSIQPGLFHPVDKEFGLYAKSREIPS